MRKLKLNLKLLEGIFKVIDVSSVDETHKHYP